jgi:predicted RNase H-like HicB family nuclease
MRHNNTSNLRYTVAIIPLDGGYFVQFSHLPDTFTEGAMVE